jgi:hypothetical protein
MVLVAPVYRELRRVISSSRSDRKTSCRGMENPSLLAGDLPDHEALSSRPRAECMHGRPIMGSQIHQSWILEPYGDPCRLLSPSRPGVNRFSRSPRRQPASSAQCTAALDGACCNVTGERNQSSPYEAYPLSPLLSKVSVAGQVVSFVLIPLAAATHSRHCLQLSTRTSCTSFAHMTANLPYESIGTHRTERKVVPWVMYPCRQ